MKIICIWFQGIHRQVLGHPSMDCGFRSFGYLMKDYYLCFLFNFIFKCAVCKKLILICMQKYPNPGNLKSLYYLFINSQTNPISFCGLCHVQLLNLSEECAVLHSSVKLLRNFLLLFSACLLLFQERLLCLDSSQFANNRDIIMGYQLFEDQSQNLKPADEMDYLNLKAFRKLCICIFKNTRVIDRQILKWT